MEITYLGHSSFRLKGKSVAMITDPYTSDETGIKFPRISADIVSVSHSHADHNFVEGVKDVQRVINGPGEYEIGGVSVIGMSSFHDGKNGQERGKNTIYIIEMDGMRLAHLGDLGHKLTDKMLEDIGTIDILMIPVGGFYTIGPAEAAEVVRDIEPIITIPMHYKTPDLNQQVFGQLSGVEDFLKEVGLTVENLDRLTIKKSEMTEENKVVVLERIIK